jgi:hypothetical protein
MLHIDGDGILTGASGVEVAGSLYDVRFLDGSCAALFAGCDDAAQDFVFASSAAASLAAQALLDQVLIDTGAGAFDSQPDLTSGCSLSGFCSVYVAFAVSDGLVSIVFAENFFSGDDSVIEILVPVDLDATDSSVITYAVWSPVTVPEPGTFGLLALGLAVGSLMLGRKAAR